MRHATNYARMAGPGDWWTPPDDDGLTDCPVCDAKGYVNELDEDNKPWKNVCPCCDGHRLLDEDGQPYDRDALQKLCEGE